LPTRAYKFAQIFEFSCKYQVDLGPKSLNIIPYVLGRQFLNIIDSASPNLSGVRFISRITFAFQIEFTEIVTIKVVYLNKQLAKIGIGQSGPLFHWIPAIDMN